MNRIYLLLTLLLLVASTYAQTPAKQPGYRIKYDHKALRIPGNKFAIGMTIPAEGKKKAAVIGYTGTGGWGKYHVEVDSGSFSGENVKLHASKLYKKGDSVSVNVYTRKWFLGGRGKFLTSRRIPYDYEDSITLLTNSNSGRFPGGHIKFGVRTIYDDHQTADLWYPVKKSHRNDFLLGFEGGYLSKKKGDWKVDNDLEKIQNDQVRLFARLGKDTAITDTLKLLLDYKAQYQLAVRSADEGHELEVFADVFNDTIIHQLLMKVEVHDLATQKMYQYLINTQGGGIRVTSSGADGASGDNGGDGLAGSNGADGAISQVPVQTVNADGTTTTTMVDTQGPGGDGGNGGDADNGQNGDNGYNGGKITVKYTAAAAPFLPMIAAVSIPGGGGSGGSGGTGGSGGSGGSGAPPGRSGRKGADGTNGQSGNPGAAGAVSYVAL